MNKKLTLSVLTAAALLGGVGAGLVGVASAQTPTTTTAVVSTQTSAVSAPSTGTASTTSKPHGHAPIGGDGNVTSISGNIFTMQEESDEGGASYSVDVTNAAFTKDGASATLVDIKVGDKIFVKGTVSGTSVSATNVNVGHFGGSHDPHGAPTTTTGTQAQ